MLKPFASLFQGCVLDSSSMDFKQLKRTKAFIYRDELSDEDGDFEAAAKSVSESEKSSDCYLKEKKGGGGGVGAEMRVKVRMTKQEAARFLARCKEGGLLDFKDVAKELVEIPVSRVNIVDDRKVFKIGTAGEKVRLETIPE